MTKRELYTTMADYFRGGKTFETSEDAEAFMNEAAALCDKEIASLDTAAARNVKRRQEKAEENAPLFEAVEQLLADKVGTEEKGVTASDAAAALDISVQKASSLLRQLVADGKANVEDAKIPKKGTQKFYTQA